MRIDNAWIRQYLYKKKNMKSNTLLSALSLQSFYDFVKLNIHEQSELLLEEGVILDLDSDYDTLTRLYFLDGFFVEEIICKRTNEVLEVIPYKQGYKLKSFMGIRKGSQTPKTIRFQWCMN